VPDLVLTPLSGLESVLAPGRYGAPDGARGVSLTPHAGLALASIMVRAGKTSELTKRVEDIFGVTLPLTPKRVDTGTIAFVWAGPGQWLAMAEHTDGHTFAQMLQRDLKGRASVIDQSDGRTVLRVGGPKARDAFAKGISLDLHPSVFRTDDTALTLAGHINVHIWQVDEAPTYEIVVFRSFAAALCGWLKEAAAEFGVAVQG